MSRKSPRREFLKHVAAAGAGFWVTGRLSAAPSRSPHEKLNVACIGVGGRGAGNVEGVKGENIVALCEVDARHGSGVLNAYPNVPKFTDFRRMFDKMHKDIDAVTVSTPDHMHAMITLAAMQLGKHVYCEKPLTRTVAEARRVTLAAAKYKVATQMGNGGNSSNGARRTVELIRSGAIGPVREIHSWTDRPGAFWKQGLERPKERPAIPETLDWECWLGVAPHRPYHKVYLPGSWRGWYDFGTGALGDMACHICNVFFWGLDLRDPTAIAADVSDRREESFPASSHVIWEFPERNGRAALKFHWYDGGRRPSREATGIGSLVDNGSVLIGDKGRMYLDNPNGSNAILLPEKQFEGFQRPSQTLPGGTDHHGEWIQACKDGKFGMEWMSHFGRAGLMTEALLLGNIAIRTGRRIEWDARNMKVTNVPEANAYVDEPCRNGWEF
jgi:predicted dehydrogenase